MNTNCLTSPLTSYEPMLQERAAELFRRVTDRVGGDRARQEKGSYSILRDSHGGVAAKIIIYRSKRRQTLPEGIYILLGTFPRETSGVETIAVGPWWDSRYAYLRLAADQSLDEMADFIAACAARSNWEL